MTQPPRRPIPLLGEVQLGPRAARALPAELARHTGPTSALLVAATASAPALAAAREALRGARPQRVAGRRPCRCGRRRGDQECARGAGVAGELGGERAGGARAELY